VRLKLDENVTVAAKDPLVALGHEVDTVADEDLTGRPDPTCLPRRSPTTGRWSNATLASATRAPTRPRAIAA
jgi:hypothetical protein